MALMTWWRPDALLNGIAAHEARARLRDGHHAYIAAINGRPVGYGWAATRRQRAA